MTEVTEKANDFIAPRQADIATVCGVSIDTVKNWVKQGMPGEPGNYDLAVVIPWLRQSGPWKQRVKPNGTDDPLLTPDAGDSPALERYRLAKARIAEYELAERKGRLIDVQKARAALARWATILRSAGERLAKRYDNDAAGILNDALFECDTVITHEFADPVEQPAESLGPSRE